MNLSLEQAIWATQVITGIAVFLQSIENWFLPISHPAWRWDLVRQDFLVFKPPVRRLADFLLQKHFHWILILNLILSIGLIFNLGFAWPLFFGILLVSLRWRGAFNGGSDAMTLQVLGALLVGGGAESQRYAVYYIAAQSAASYFLAGVAKLRNPIWRQGLAVRDYLRSGGYSSIDSWLGMPILNWAVLGLECVFPIIFIIHSTWMVLLPLALVFHFANVYIFGLNRFFWAWLATYPSLIYLVGR